MIWSEEQILEIIIQFAKDTSCTFQNSNIKLHAHCGKRHELQMFENQVVRKIFGLRVMNEVGMEDIHNKEIGLYNSCNTVGSETTEVIMAWHAVQVGELSHSEF